MDMSKVTRGRKRVGPNTMPRFPADIMFCSTFIETLWRQRGEELG
jgi:hypothetical protein